MVPPESNAGTAGPARMERQPAIPDASMRASAPRSSAGEGSTAVPGAPTSIQIPAIDVHAPVVTLGLNPDKSVQVPPLDKPYETGWYAGSALPGHDGAAVILGHVDAAATGPAVFYNLAKMRPGDSITIALAGHAEVAYQVDGVREYQKTALPASLIYGPLPYPGLRLITCGGQFDYQTGHYLDNVVVYASMIGATASQT